MVCSVKCFDACMCWFPRTSSLKARVSCQVGSVAPGKYGDEIFAGTSKDTLSRGQLCAGIRGMLVLKYGLCECVGVLVATGNLCYW